MNLKPVFIYKLENPKGIKQVCLRFYETLGLGRITAILLVVVLVFQGSNTATATDANNDAIDDRLNVALAPAEDMFFPDTGAEITETMAEITFDTGTANTYTSNGVQAALVSNSATTRTIGDGSGTLSLVNALVWGGAGGTGRYAQPGDTNNSYTLRFTNTQRYLGFWWSAGNSDNNLQLLDTNGNVITNFTTFTTQSVLNAIFPSGSAVTSCPSDRPTAEDIATTSGLAYCGNPVRDENGAYAFTYVDEPFAFIHLRYADGFGGLRVWGTGFEFDNLTFSETNPAASADEVAVGGGLNTTCTGVGALANGGFEDFGFQNTPGSTQFSSGSSSWRTTATDGQIEIWRGLPVDADDSAISGPTTASARGGTTSGGVTRGNISELQANPGGGDNQGLYQDIQTVGGSTIRYSFWHHARSGGGSNQNQQVTVRIGAVPSPDPADSGWTSAEQSTAATSFGTQGVVSSLSTTAVWTRAEGSYTVPAGQSITRFLFVSLVNGGSASYGNLLDDIEFTPTLACPDTTSIIVNRSAVTFSPIANDFRPSTQNTITVVSITGSGSATVNGTNLQLSSTTAGTYTVRYRLTNSFGDTSQTNLVVTVLAEANPRASNVVLVDPRLSQVTIPDFNFTGSTNLKVCVDEWNGSSISAGTPPLKFDVSTKSSIQTSGNGGATIDGDRTGSLRIRHTQANTESTLNSAGGLTAYLDSGTFSLTRYIRLRTLPISASDSDDSCDNASASFSSTIEIRPLGIDQIFHKNTIPLKNQ